jgi:hypothetical protein
VTQSQALELYHAHDVGLLLDNAEEVEMLTDANPLLLEAYRALAKLAGKDT